jgi:predicted nucleic acid-binding protein
MAMTGSAVLVDTSIYVGQEQGRPFLAEVPDYTATSIITVAELRAGVLTAPDVATRNRRIDTLTRAMATTPLPIDGPVAVAWAELRVALRDAGRKLPANDAWIAATAIAHGLPLLTQDDYRDVPGLEVIRV